MGQHDKEGYPLEWDADEFIHFTGEGQHIEYPGGIMDADLTDKMVIYGATVDPMFHLKVIPRI